MIIRYNRKGLGRPHKRRLELLLLVGIITREVGALERRRQHARPHLDRSPRALDGDTQELLGLFCVRRVREARHNHSVQQG